MSSRNPVPDSADVQQRADDPQSFPHTGMLIVDRELRVLVLEGEIYKSYARSSAIGRPVAEIVSAETWKLLGPRYRAALAGETQAFRLRAPHGVGAWTVRMSPTRREVAMAAPPDGVMVFVKELQAEGSPPLQDQAIVEVLSEGVVVVGRDSALVQANSAARAILGYPLDPADRDTDWWCRLDARHPDGVELALVSPGQEVRRSGRDLRDLPVSVRRADGERRSLQLNYRPLRDGAGRPGGLVISFHDVTEQEAEHERLATSEARLRDAHELAAMSSWEWDVRRDRVVVMQGLPGQLEGRTETGVGIHTLLETVAPEDRERIARRVAALRAGATDHESLAYRYRLEDGQTRWVETRMRAVRDEGGLRVVCGTTQDITASHHAASELAEAHDFLRSTMDSLAGHLAVLDADGVVITVNAAWEGFATGNGGDPVATGVGSNYLQVCDDATGDDAAHAAAGLRSMIAGTSNGFTLDYACHSPTAERWFTMRADPHRSAGPMRIVVQHTDITERRQAEQEAWVRARLLDEVHAAVIAIDTSGVIRVWSRGAETLFGWTAAEMVARPLSELTVGTDLEHATADIMSRLRSEGQWVGELELRRKNGTTFPADIRNTVLRDADGTVTGLIGVALDVTERVRNERELRSARDYLGAVTGSMAQGMCALDVDGRAIYVNQAAEKIIGWSAAELMGKPFHELVHFRHPDGTPYPVADCPFCGTRRDREIAHSEDDVFIRSDGVDIPVEYSASSFETPEGIRGAVLLFSDITERKAEEARMHHDLDELAWVGRINDAIEQDRLVLHAQPIIDLVTGATVQHELLIRMLDDDGSAILPGAFLPAAERYGLVREIDRWVVRRAAELSAQGHTVELNISADSLGDRDFAATVEHELRLSAANCSLIVIELTETAILRDEEAGSRFIERMQRLGCRIALDDFGTGYGGFTYLKRLNVDYLKIDVEFVRDLPHNAASQHVVRAVVSLARDFEQKTVAEGVENAETLHLLRELGVDHAQGYHIARPTPLDHALGLPTTIHKRD